MKRLRLASYIVWSAMNTLGMILGAFAWKIAGDGVAVIAWCALWELYVLHKIFECLEER